MNIVILGAGEIGSYLAQMLSKEGHSITVIDREKAPLEKVANQADVATMRSQGSRWESLSELLESRPELFIAMTGSDEINLVTCTIAKKLGYPKTIARVRDMGTFTKVKLDFNELFSVDHLIGSEILTAEDILKSILHPSDLILENFAHGLLQMRTLTLSEDWPNADKTLEELNLPDEINIALINRQGKVIFPGGQDKLLAQDEITVIGNTRILEEIQPFFYVQEKKVGSVVLVGGTPVAMRLALILEKRNIKVKIIEQDEKKCSELSELLMRSRIVNRDAASSENLLQERVFDADYFVACTNDDRRNIVIALLAKYVGCKKILCSISDMSLGPLLTKEKIFSTISERVNLVNRVLAIIHAQKVISITSLAGDSAKIFEVKLSFDSKLLNRPLAELKNKLPPRMLIAAVEKKGRIIVGKGSTVLAPEDTMIVIGPPESLGELEALL
ncbi:MAG: Trk system potassium transporter TrkA [Parachlamydiales bacterium]|jgi:trk system potassium uptake protein TrkA